MEEHHQTEQDKKDYTNQCSKANVYAYCTSDEIYSAGSVGSITPLELDLKRVDGKDAYKKVYCEVCSCGEESKVTTRRIACKGSEIYIVQKPLMEQWLLSSTM